MPGQPTAKGFEAAARSLLKGFRTDQQLFGDRPAGKLQIDLPIHFLDPDSPQWTDRTIPKPVWIQTPNPKMMDQFYPPKAAAAGVESGRAVVQCTVQANGQLGDCTAQPDPADSLGFGEAAARVASLFAMNPWTTEGMPVDGVKVSMPLRLVMPKAPTASQ